MPCRIDVCVIPADLDRLIIIIIDRMVVVKISAGHDKFEY